METHGYNDKHHFLFLKIHSRIVKNEILFKEIHPLATNFQHSLSIMKEFLSDTRISAIFSLEQRSYNLMKKNHHTGDVSITLNSKFRWGYCHLPTPDKDLAQPSLIYAWGDIPLDKDLT